MPITHESDLHRRRMGRNVGLGVVLGCFVLMVFALAVAKFSDEGLMGVAPGQPVAATPVTP